MSIIISIYKASEHECSGSMASASQLARQQHLERPCHVPVTMMTVCISILRENLGDSHIDFSAPDNLRIDTSWLQRQQMAHLCAGAVVFAFTQAVEQGHAATHPALCQDSRAECLLGLRP